MEDVIMLYYETNYLAHHGVKGMKWGHRKQKVLKGRKTGQKKATSDRLFGGIKSDARRKAFTKSGQLKSSKRIVAETMGQNLLMEAGSVGAQLALNKMGQYGISKVVGLAMQGAVLTNTAIGITSAVQAGRGRYGKGK